MCKKLTQAQTTLFGSLKFDTWDIIKSVVLQLNHVELSPNYAGTLFGITNMVANLTGFITPWVAGRITNYDVSKI